MEELAGPRYRRGRGTGSSTAGARRAARVSGGSEGAGAGAAGARPARRPEVRPAYETAAGRRGAGTAVAGAGAAGLGCRNYQETAALVRRCSGCRRRRCRGGSSGRVRRKLQALMERDLSATTWWRVPGREELRGRRAVIAIGVTLAVEGRCWDWCRPRAEHKGVPGVLKSLVERGLSSSRGCCGAGRAKGSHGAVREVFGNATVIQRCRWHKRENVLAYRPESRRPAMRRKLQAAYEEPTYDQAKAGLKRVRSEWR